MNQLTKKDLTDLYWILVQYVEDCDPRSASKTNRIFNKIETLWSQVK
jgi:hypothetical protein